MLLVGVLFEERESRVSRERKFKICVLFVEKNKKMMKSCELCKSKARIYCDSDQANLCWNCDSKVHSANFLVARHSRNLLCRVCQSPTPWNASGEKLGPSAVSVCEKCVVHGTSDDDREEEEENNGVDYVDQEYDGDEDGEIEVDNDDDEDDDDRDDDVQVVPLCCTPPPAVSSSSSDDISVSVKRKRENVVTDLSSSEDDVDCCSAMRGKRATLYQFLPSSSDEKMKSSGDRKEISGGKEYEAVGVCNGTRAVGLELNLLLD